MVKVGGVEYAVRKMAPRAAQHVLRRILPLMTAAVPVILALLEGEVIAADKVRSRIAESIGPVVNILAEMKDADFDHVMDACLSHVDRLDAADGKLHPIYVRAGLGMRPMYQDIGAQEELQLAGAVIQENFSGFFAQLSGGGAPPLSSSGPAPQA